MPWTEVVCLSAAADWSYVRVRPLSVPGIYRATLLDASYGVCPLGEMPSDDNPISAI